MAEQSEPWRKPRRTSWIPRILAPLALVAVVIAVFVIVNSTVGDSGGGSSDGNTAVSPQKGEIPKAYTVQAGDSLTSIADKFGISIKRLERLNPDVDSQTLNEGAELKLH
jgi:LysM repeat protein